MLFQHKFELLVLICFDFVVDSSILPFINSGFYAYFSLVSANFPGYKILSNDMTLKS